MTTTPKSEGQRQLLEQEGSEIQIAKKLGTGKAIIGHWRRGRRLPADGMRHRLELAFGIPPRAWDVAPGEPLPVVAPPELPAALEPAGPPCVDDDPLMIARQQLQEVRVALQDENLTSTAAAKLRDTAAKLLALVSRLELARELQEDRVVRHHPKWKRVKAAIVKALEPYPEAAAAVAEALE